MGKKHPKKEILVGSDKLNRFIPDLNWPDSERTDQQLEEQNDIKSIPDSTFDHQLDFAPFGNGWVLVADYHNTSPYPVTLLRGRFRVPKIPQENDYQSLFLFPGLRNQNILLQCVVHWGPTAAGPPNGWSASCWEISPDGNRISYTTHVQSGDLLTAEIRLISLRDSL
ncbi:hypothetical protein [Pedobacter panaciterrae]